LTLNDLTHSYIIGEQYDLPYYAPRNLEVKFEFLGTAGNGTKLQFKAIPGDWTISLAPVQILVNSIRSVSQVMQLQNLYRRKNEK